MLQQLQNNLKGRKVIKFILAFAAIAVLIITLQSNSIRKDYGGGDRDVVEQLYQVEVKNNSNLSDIEDGIEAFYKKKKDAYAAYNTFTNFNTNYYIDAKRKANTINDATTKQKALDILTKSETAYFAKMTEWNATIATLNANEKELYNLHSLLKITVTEPVVAAYQTKELPDNKAATAVNTELTKIIEKIKVITK
jgi:hypothetical protein